VQFTRLNWHEIDFLAKHLADRFSNFALVEKCHWNVDKCSHGIVIKAQHGGQLLWKLHHFTFSSSSIGLMECHLRKVKYATASYTLNGLSVHLVNRVG